jgi:hypothetical protein
MALLTLSVPYSVSGVQGSSLVLVRVAGARTGSAGSVLAPGRNGSGRRNSCVFGTK